jgi:hypothetical protein
VKETLITKLEDGALGGKKVEKSEVRKLVAEVANKLCV